MHHGPMLTRSMREALLCRMCYGERMVGRIAGIRIGSRCLGLCKRIAVAAKVPWDASVLTPGPAGKRIEK